METRLLIELVAIFVLVLANSFFALAEFSIIASRASRLAQKKAEGKMGAALAEKLQSQPDRFLASVQVGITLVGALLGVFSGATIVSRIEEALIQSSWPWLVESAAGVAMAIVVLVITVMSVLLGELVPKYIALTFPERYARYLAAPVSFFIAATSPFSRLLSWMANLIVRSLGFKQSTSPNQVSEEEINQMMVDGRRRGVFDVTEQEFIRSVFDFSDSTVKRALTPRPDVIALEKSARSSEIMAVIREQGYSRYPIYVGTIDKVVGIIYTKDFLATQVDLNRIDLTQLMRKPLHVPDSMPLAKLLREFQSGRNHMAVVLDEFGGTAGIITLEDVLEELVGEIQDEYDAEAAPIVKHSDNSLFVAGDVWPGDANELIDSHLPEDSHDTLAGLIIDTLGRFPEKHDSLKIADVRLTILAKDENRILRLKVEKLTGEAQKGTADD